MKKGLLSAFLLLIVQNLFAVQFPSLEPQFETRKYNGKNLSGRKLIELSLEYSLCPPDSERGMAALRKFDSLSEAVSRKSVLSLPEDKRAEEILSLMYEKVLDHYDIKHTTADDALVDGVYNCVSSVILFASCAKICNLETVYYKTEDHAFCAVKVPVYAKNSGTGGAGSKIIRYRFVDVETTNPNGFDPGTRKQLESKNGQTRYLVVNKKNYANRVEISEKVLAGLIAGNICSGWIKTGEYFKAIPLGASRIDLSRKEGDSKGAKFARTEFDILCRNYINSFQTSSDFKNGILFADKVVERWGMTDYFQKYYDSLISNASIDAANKNQFDLSVSYFDENKKNLSKPGYAKKSEMQEYCWLKKVDQVVRKKDFLAAVKMTDEALNEVPKSKKLSQIRAQCFQNYDIEIYNRCVPLINGNKFDEAKKILEEGLRNHPESTLLQKDLKICSY